MGNEEKEVKEQILQVPGNQVGEIVIIPPGMKSDNPLVQAASIATKNVELKNQVDTLNSEKTAMSKEIESLKEKLSAFEKKDIVDAATGLVDKRVKAGLTKEEDRKTEVEKFSKLNLEQISVLKADVEKMSALKKEDSDEELESAGRKDEKPEKEKLSEQEKETALRKQLFGHEKPLGEE